MRVLFRLSPALMLYAVALLLGIWLRLDQFIAQVLIDDEWHAVHQLILSNPRDILLSFGHVDHSIPLTLLYWLEASWFGLSELGMRWPMMLCGLATLVLFPLYVWRTLGRSEAAIFALMLALSPLLIIYSRIARPYSITLLLVYLAHFAFHRYCNNTSHRIAYGVLYGISAVLATWLILNVGPIVVAPFFIEGISVLCTPTSDRGPRLRRLLLLGVLTAVSMLLLILPPMWANYAAISSKTGVDNPNVQTVLGVWFAWLGTPSTAIVLIYLALAVFGAARLWRELAIVRSMTLGLALTLVIILMMRPAWIHHSMIFGRYLLPAIPLLLLAVVTGTIRLADAIARQMWPMRKIMAAMIFLLPLLALATQSPLWEILRRPNSNLTHPVFFFDFRPDKNLFRERFNDTVPLSPYWSHLATLPRNSLRIAVAPFHYESYDWDAPRWERISRQTIIPGYLNGLCVDWRLGEVPKDPRFKFRNAVFLSEATSIAAHDIDRIAYQKPYPQRNDGVPVTVGEDTANCEAVLRVRFGPPRYEDDTIIVFSKSID